jgi:uncharacterized protein YeeX (DUF496 family)
MPLKYEVRIQANRNTNNKKVEDNMKNIKVEDDVHGYSAPDYSLSSMS